MAVPYRFQTGLHTEIVHMKHMNLFKQMFPHNTMPFSGPTCLDERLNTSHSLHYCFVLLSVYIPVQLPATRPLPKLLCDFLLFINQHCAAGWFTDCIG